jgi:hypothetical protein
LLHHSQLQQLQRSVFLPLPCIDIAVHGINLLLMLTDVFLSKTSFVPSHAISVIILPIIYCFFQWVHHAHGGSWAYPFLDTSKVVVINVCLWLTLTGHCAWMVHVVVDYASWVLHTGCSHHTHQGLVCKVSLSVCLSVCLSVSLLCGCLLVCLNVCVSVCLSVCMYMYVSVCVFVCLSACLSECLSES